MNHFDSQTDVLCIADALCRKPGILHMIKRAMIKAGISIRYIVNTKNIWVRDYMPIQIGERFIKFRYIKEFQKYPQLIVTEQCYNFLPNLTYSDIVLDGGNCVSHGDKTIVTDLIFKHNRDYNKKSLVKELESLLQTQLIIIPHEPYDRLGHADGIVRWIDEKTVFVSNFTDKEYIKKLLKSLDGFNIILFPCTIDNYNINRAKFRIAYPFADEYNPAPGYYINYLHIDNIILVSTFNTDDDEFAIQLLKKYFPTCELVPIYSYNLAMEGGLLNCVTMNYHGRKLCFP